MTQQFTHAQLEAWAGLSWKLALSDDTTILDKDRRIVAELCCSDNEDSDHLDYNNPDEWPLLERNAALIAAAPDLARLVLEKDAEIARLKAQIKDIKECWDWWQEDTYDRCSTVVDDAIRQAMKEPAQ